jgi:urease accessory protein
MHATWWKPMFDATLRCEVGSSAAALQRGSGAAEIVFARRGNRTVLRHLYQRTPCRVLFPRVEPGEPPVAVLLTTSGGLTGGDTIRLRIAAEAAAVASVTTQAAEKLYRSLGPDTTIEVAIEVAAGATLDYLPQETILFDGARLNRRTRIDVADGGRLLAAEMLVFGRSAHGERLSRGRVYDGWRIHRSGRLVWADALALDGDIAAALANPLAFAGAAALATALFVGNEAASLLPCARALAEGGASVVGGVLVVRLFGPQAGDVRARLAGVLSGLRAAVGLPAGRPRVWQS